MQCEYGCEQEAKFQLSNKKWCCSNSWNSCPKIRKKNSEAIKKAHKEGRIPTKQLDKKRAWAKGLTKQTSEAIRRISEANSIRLKKIGFNNPFVKASIERSKTKNHPAHIKQSETRKKLYAQGLLTPAKGIGRGKYSYFIFNNKKVLLRSTFEFIFALYLVYKHIKFDYENIRVQYNGSTRINDFDIEGKLYEIKGFRGSHVDKVVEAFKNNGYVIRVIFYETLLEIIKFFRRRNIPIDNYIKLITEGHNLKQYFTFDSDNFRAQVVKLGDTAGLRPAETESHVGSTPALGI